MINDHCLVGLLYNSVLDPGSKNKTTWKEYVRKPPETDSVKSQISSKTSSGKKDSTNDKKNLIGSCLFLFVYIISHLVLF